MMLLPLSNHLNPHLIPLITRPSIEPLITRPSSARYITCGVCWTVWS